MPPHNSGRRCRVYAHASRAFFVPPSRTHDRPTKQRPYQVLTDHQLRKPARRRVALVFTLSFLELTLSSNTLPCGIGNGPRADYVSIIAIHDLNGHREKTWTAENGVLWLQVLLPATIPNARILVYGWDADTHSKEHVSSQTIPRHAEKFVQSFSRQRSGNPRRPIIFIAHRVGGIVLKQALVLCHVKTLGVNNQLRDILVSTHAILFFGTPHFGVKGVELHLTLTSFCQPTRRQQILSSEFSENTHRI